MPFPRLKDSLRTYSAPECFRDAKFGLRTVQLPEKPPSICANALKIR